MTLDPYERYKEKPFPGSSHTWAFNQLERYLPADCETTQVLDVGPGSGIIGRFLKEKGCEALSAIEIDAATREELKPLYGEIVPSLSELHREKKYDVVILLDVLEHMSDPYGFLSELSNRLSNGALLFISVPNITHWAIRLMVLFGYFEYMERGPLDRTHLQFFSRRRFHELLHQVDGATVKNSSGTIEPLELLLPMWATNNLVFKTLSHCRMWFSDLWPALFAYQHVGVIQVSSERAS